MLEPAVVVLRLVQYAGATVLMGWSLFLFFAPPAVLTADETRLARRWLVISAAALGVAAAFWVIAQTATMAGSLTAGLRPESLAAVVGGTGLGRAGVLRTVAGAIAVVAMRALRPGPTAWATGATLGAAACGSLAWMGHGAASEGVGGVIHLASDLVHVWAAAVWIGALCVFAALLARPPASAAALAGLQQALRNFSGAGSVIVAVLLVTGLVNSWFLIGPLRFDAVWTTPYGRLLCAKVALFFLMLGLAALNRFKLTPALGEVLGAASDPSETLRRLRHSLLIETGAAFSILALVAWLGTLAPPAAQ